MKVQINQMSKYVYFGEVEQGKNFGILRSSARAVSLTVSSLCLKSLVVSALHRLSAAAPADTVTRRLCTETRHTALSSLAVVYPSSFGARPPAGGNCISPAARGSSSKGAVAKFSCTRRLR